jgi:hypothetical protein
MISIGETFFFFDPLSSSQQEQQERQKRQNRERRDSLPHNEDRINRSRHVAVSRAEEHGTLLSSLEQICFRLQPNKQQERSFLGTLSIEQQML